MSEPAQQDDTGRDAKGRYKPGVSGNPNGCPITARQAAFRKIMFETITPEDMQSVIIKLVQMAQGGDMFAIRELFDRMLGKAVAMTELNISTFTSAGLRADLESIGVQLGEKK